MSVFAVQGLELIIILLSDQVRKKCSPLCISNQYVVVFFCWTVKERTEEFLSIWQKRSSPYVWTLSYEVIRLLWVKQKQQFKSLELLKGSIRKYIQWMKSILSCSSQIHCCHVWLWVLFHVHVSCPLFLGFSIVMFLVLSSCHVLPFSCVLCCHV